MSSALDVLLLALLHGSVVAAIVWALDLLLRPRVSPALSGALWTVALARFLLPVGPAVIFSPGLALPPLPSAALAPIALYGRAGAPAAGSHWTAILLAAWLLAALAIAARRILAARSLARSIDGLAAASPALLASVREAASRLGLRRAPAVRTGAGPFIAGWLRPTLVVPFDRCDTGESRAMILHELAHLRRGDPWVRALQLLAQTVFFFWPPVRWVNRKIEQYRELACDQLALEHGALSPSAYARLLLEAGRGAVARPWQFAVLEMSSHASRLERRIDMVLDLNHRRSRKWTALAAFSAAALALGGTAFAVDARGAGDAGVAPADPADEAMIKTVVREHRAQIRACFDAALLSSPVLEGKLVFGWTITPAGAASSGCVLESDFGPLVPAEQTDALWHCVSAAIMKWQFPPPKSGKKIDVSYPFVFKPHPVPLIGEPDEP